MTALNPEFGSTQLRLSYDGEGNLVRRSHNNVVTNYLVDTNNPTGYSQIVEEIVSGAVTKQFTYGHDLISQRIITNNVVAFYQYDGHGSVRHLTNPAGAITDTYVYDAFGVHLQITNAVPNDYLYAGERYDAQFKFYYLRARHLNSTTGRFLSMDSFEGINSEPVSLHKYLYANANPANMIDPSGHLPLGLVEWWHIFWIGTLVHNQIGQDFMLRGAGRFANHFPISTILGIPAANCLACGLKPDLADSLSRRVWEIKPVKTGLIVGQAQLTTYLYILN